MKANRILPLLLTLLLIVGLPMQAQEDALPNLDTIHTATSDTNDSLRLQYMQEALEATRLNEANLRLELEQLRLQTASADSLKRDRLRQRIDSLRQVTPGVPLVVEDDTLFYLYAKRGGHTPHNRALADAAIITELGKRFRLQPDSVYIEHTDIVSDVMYGDRVIISFTDQDALWENCTRQQLAERARTIIVEKLRAIHKEHSFLQFCKNILYFVLVLIGQYLLYRATLWLYRRAKRRIQRLKDTRLKPISIQTYEILDTQKQVNLLIFAANIVRYLLIILQLLFTVPLLFSIFPQTKDLAYKIFYYIWDPVKSILKDVVNYIPNLFTILVIFYVIRYIIKGLRYLAGEIDSGRLKINGFYPDWAMPTLHIIRFLLYAFMIALIYPYLPNSDSGVFQGISVFVGLIVSLGSSTVIGNIIAGLVITYMRPFKQGDRIKLNDTVGNVVEKTALVTRIRTPKNEVVTIPNSFMMSSHTVNYSESARSYGLIIHTEVSIGYDVPWRRVHQLLIDAALTTQGVQADPPPFVLETSKITLTAPVSKSCLRITSPPGTAARSPSPKKEHLPTSAPKRTAKSVLPGHIRYDPKSNPCMKGLVENPFIQGLLILYKNRAFSLSYTITGVSFNPPIPLPNRVHRVRHRIG